MAQSAKVRTAARVTDSRTRYEDRRAKPVALHRPRPVDVQVTKPTRRDLVYTITLPANISPLYQTTLYAKVSGYLKWIGPDKGDAVKKNQVVAIIDAPEVEEQYQQAVADYKIKKFTFERLDQGLERIAGCHRQARRGCRRSSLSRRQDISCSNGRRCATTPKCARPTTASSRPALPTPAP